MKRVVESSPESCFYHITDIIIYRVATCCTSHKPSKVWSSDWLLETQFARNNFILTFIISNIFSLWRLWTLDFQHVNMLTTLVTTVVHVKTWQPWEHIKISLCCGCSFSKSVLRSTILQIKGQHKVFYIRRGLAVQVSLYYLTLLVTSNHSQTLIKTTTWRKILPKLKTFLWCQFCEVHTRLDIQKLKVIGQGRIFWNVRLSKTGKSV